MPLTLGGAPIENGGVYVQFGVTFVLVALCFTVPVSQRILKLENSHRSFAISMEDVSRAYASAHASDREGVFQATSEFDAVKERIIALQAHSDLGSLEPDILEVAAKMSHVSADLAQAFSDDRVDRARDFLVQRQQEIDVFNERLDRAKALHADILQWARRVELDEAVARSQIERLAADLQDILPEIGSAGSTASSDNNGVVRIPKIVTN
ncbi:MAG: DNA repair protein [Pseudomonadota bacterium]